ncbi:hypothetical protein ACIQM4_00680 [Streptomyces sp. NPDC091272]|uniref:hypothetical protein n=1 Tax=Streptomyces sp. NPDC091272 TaxID=3365981 RepID=UPI0038283089
MRETDAPDTPTAPGFLDYATRPSKAADRPVLSELGALTPPPGTVHWDERRLTELAAAAPVNTAANPVRRSGAGPLATGLRARPRH